ncbi:MAG TPA: TldD/PmbA family protein [Bacteroidales bacterium]|nr:TldD/PmbA family protein [Bacteroidales bacterium]
MITTRKIGIFATLLLTAVTVKAGDSLQSILQNELQRELSVLSKQSLPAYYIQYRVDDIKNYSIAASFGSLTDEDSDNSSLLNVEVRIGDYTKDNTHITKLSDERPSIPVTLALPIEKNKEAIEIALWQATHYAYRKAADEFNNIQSGMLNDAEEGTADFSKETPNVYYEAPLDFNKEKLSYMRERMKNISGFFTSTPEIQSADARFSYVYQRKYFANTEGTDIVQNNTYCQIQVVVVSKAEDGNYVPLVKTYSAFNPDSLPSEATIMQDMQQMLNLLKQLRNAPVADAYSGPAILSPDAAAVFFHEIFGHRIEGQRMKNNFDSQIFKNKVGSRIINKHLTVVSDPTMKNLGKLDMFGYYKYDDQGIKASRVELVKDGVLKDFLMSRTPIKGFEHSNGHGRSQTGLSPVSRQSNLIITSNQVHSKEKLRKMLIAECKKQNKTFGYYFDQVIGGFTLTNRFTPNVFNVSPVVVYRVYVDGRPDELVRGINFIGTPLAIFEGILAAGDQYGVFTGYCGAESGSIPVTASAPSLLIKKIETQKKPEGLNTKPILPRPDFIKENK